MTLKTWEVYKIALENPKAKFKFLSDGLDKGKIFKVSNGVLVLDTRNGAGILFPPIDVEWELVRESVDFMTAAKAYAEGKTIKCEWDEKSTMIYKPRSNEVKFNEVIDQDKGGITVGEILDGKWYIED